MAHTYYFIFFISFTQAGFLDTKLYTPKIMPKNTLATGLSERKMALFVFALVQKRGYGLCESINGSVCIWRLVQERAGETLVQKREGERGTIGAWFKVTQLVWTKLPWYIRGRETLVQEREREALVQKRERAILVQKRKRNLGTNLKGKPWYKREKGKPWYTREGERLILNKRKRNLGTQ